jgi:hypothetical protein
MIPGACFNEFPISTSEEMTQTFNGDVVDYSVHVEREQAEDLSIEDLSIEQQKDLEIHIEQQKDLTLEN